MPARKLEWKKIKADDQEGTPLLITPLIDIMFLLLIFFVMNTSFSRFSPLEINLPESEAQSETVGDQLTLILKNDGNIVINGERLTLETLTSFLESRREERGEESVIIAGDESISYAFLVHVMDKVSQAGLQDITLLTESQ